MSTDKEFLARVAQRTDGESIAEYARTAGEARAQVEAIPMLMAQGIATAILLWADGIVIGHALLGIYFLPPDDDDDYDPWDPSVMSPFNYQLDGIGFGGDKPLSRDDALKALWTLVQGIIDTASRAGARSVLVPEVPIRHPYGEALEAHGFVLADNRMHIHL